MAKVQYHTDGTVGVITLNDPPMNALGLQHFDELLAAVTSVKTAEIRALLLRAEGVVFSRGADISIFQGHDAKSGARMLTRYLPITHMLEDLPIPVIAVVQGLAQAAGLELALSCDLIIAGQSATFSQPEAVVGATPFLGGAARLAKRCGDARAREIVYSMQAYDAATFERWNIVNRVVPDEALQQEAMGLAKRLAAGPTLAFGATKKLIRTYQDRGLRAADDALVTDSVRLFETEDLRAAVDWFVTHGRESKRPPNLGYPVNFKGR